MPKVSLNTIGSRYGSIDALNDNFDAIEAAIENTLSLDGTSPNAMTADLDLNSNDLLNVGTTNTQTLYINGIEVEPSTGVTAGSAFQTYSFTATAGQTTFSVAPATPLVSSLLVSVNGLELPPAEVTVSTTNVVIPACTLGDEVVVRRFTKEPTVYPTAATQDFQQAGTGAQIRTVQSKLRDVVSVKDFGAVGDGATDDTTAFAAAAAVINAAGGGKIIIPPGTYIVGRQTFAGTTGMGYAYLGADIIKIQNCTRPVIIEGNGAILKAATGLRFGSFNPTTGAVFNPGSLPFTDNDYRAIPYVAMIELLNNASVEVSDLELDGNISGLVLGGFWGDTGRQIPACGIRAYGNANLSARNVYTHHHGLDGLLIGYASLTETSPEYPHTFINVVSEYNARQGLSWVGGTQLTAIDCKFNNTGKAVFSSSPSAGLDIEAESSVCRNGTFINCEMQNNTGVGMLADSGDSADVLFLRCKFIGQTQYPIWPNKPRLTFSDCTIVGSYVNSFYSSTKPEDACKYQRCLFTDESKYASSLYNLGVLSANLSATSTQTNVVYDRCAFITTRSRPGRFDGAKLFNCTFDVQAGTSITANQDLFVTFNGAYLQDIYIKDNIATNIPTDAFYVAFNSASRYAGRNQIVSGSSKLRWWSWSPGAGGYAGFLGEANGNEVPQAALSVIAGGGSPLAGYYGTNEIYYSTAAPTTGTWKRGDRFFNSQPTVGQPKSWVCTVAGTPGTWVSEGNL